MPLAASTGVRSQWCDATWPQTGRVALRTSSGSFATLAAIRRAPSQSAILCCASHRAWSCSDKFAGVLPGLEAAMRNIKRRARGTTTWLNRAGSGNDLTTLSDRDLRDLGLVRQQIGINTCKLFWLV